MQNLAVTHNTLTRLTCQNAPLLSYRTGHPCCGVDALVHDTCQGAGFRLNRRGYHRPCSNTPNCQTRGVRVYLENMGRAPPVPAKAIPHTSRPPLCNFCRYVAGALRYSFQCFILCFPPTPNPMMPNHADMEDLLRPSFIAFDARSTSDYHSTHQLFCIAAWSLFTAISRTSSPST